MKITRTHNLIELYSYVTEEIKLTEEELDLITIATDYHIKESYPAFHRTLPGVDEIREVLHFTIKLFETSCNLLKVNKNDITSKIDEND